MKKSDIKLKMDLEIANAVMCLSRKQYDEAKKSMVVALDMINKMTQIADGDEKRYLQAYSFNLEREIKYLEDKISAMATQNKGEKQSRATTVQNTVPVDVSLGISPQYLQYTFSDVAGLDDVKQIVKDKVINPYYYPGLYQMFKKKLGGGILLYGLPGTGKTMVAQAIAKETNAKFFEIKTSDVLSKWLGESCRNVREVFEQANRCSNAVVFFDEIDALTSERDDAGNEAISRVVCELLAQMDGVKKKSPQQRLLVIGATNRPWKIDSAFLRPGRFDEQIYVPLPDNEARKTISHNSIA
ncbi:MAG: ATP-binding protein [Clostridia bacterium]|nr:ATP-binding protein [Clostridia bacterium]